MDGGILDKKKTLHLFILLHVPSSRQRDCIVTEIKQRDGCVICSIKRNNTVYFISIFENILSYSDLY